MMKINTACFWAVVGLDEDYERDCFTRTTGDLMVPIDEIAVDDIDDEEAAISGFIDEVVINILDIVRVTTNVTGKEGNFAVDDVPVDRAAIDKRICADDCSL
ncbi:hypothetical protein NDU88_007531 [Pleurodeles waltl]|uniref:Uncharacterized protein n=1 Tax=Pleurodeles waltl TaxID=8319 RepID=A0AAV7RVB9_PLEWA|nr:hypothetical protein NDU88_007531 [Pleurodeles waltl]